MKRAPEVKPSVRCSVEPGAGAGAVSITKRAKLEEPEAADGFTRCSSKLVAADGSDIAMKRARKPEKPSKKEKGAGETSKRSKKRAEEKNKQPNKVEVVHDSSMEEKIMAKLAQLDKKRAEEKSKRSNQERRIEEMLRRIEKNASKVMANKVEVVKSMEQVNTELAEKSKKKMKLVTQEINQAEVGHYLSDEVWNYVMSIGVVTLEDCVINEIAMSCRDPSTEAESLAYRRRHIESQANLLRQYRTNGHAVLQYEVTDDEMDVEM